MKKNNQFDQVFSSLGVQYSPDFVYMSWDLFKHPHRKLDRALFQTVKHHFEEEFGGKALFFLKGRDAIEVALHQLGIGAGKVVFTQAFSCIALEQAILRAGATPSYVDVSEGQVNMSVDTLEKAATDVTPAAIIVQHSLGIPADIVAIKHWCVQNKVLLIEDLAQGYGGQAEDGAKLGTYADVVILSFGRDKILDSLIGGAVIFKGDVSFQYHVHAHHISDFSVLRKFLYPTLTQKIRELTPSKLAQILYHLGKLLQIISSPIQSELSGVGSFPHEFSPLLQYQIRHHHEDIAHRRMIAEKYIEVMSEHEGIFPFTIDQMLAGSCLRFPILVQQPDHVTKALEAKQIFISDRWYRSAVDSGSLSYQTMYQVGSCPNAEFLASYIINLPTHRAITPDIAVSICQEIKNVIGM